MRLLIFISIIGLTIGCDKKAPPSEASKAISMDEISIRYSRDFNNEAIKDRDTVAIDDAWMDNIVVISSADTQINGKAALKKVFVDQFNSSADAIYVRTPVKIEMMKQWGMASEVGTWEGSWTIPDGKIEIGGTYYAKWHKVRDKWLIRTEVYTPTYCTGGPYCNSIPG
ncbi:MAG: nuclear transport factor 2 family protein [Cyclobacteriaceae bacterium]